MRCYQKRTVQNYLCRDYKLNNLRTSPGRGQCHFIGVKLALTKCTTISQKQKQLRKRNNDSGKRERERVSRYTYYTSPPIITHTHTVCMNTTAMM